MSDFKATNRLLDGAGSEWNESEHPRNEEGKFTGKGSRSAPNELKTRSKTKMTPAEKIASVHIDFTKDNILPELNDENLQEMGLTENKSVLVKASVITRNAQRHSDVIPGDVDRLIGETLYSPERVFKGNNDDGKHYYTFTKELRLSPKDNKTVDNGLVLLDVDPSKDSFEVVHWHWISDPSLIKLLKRLK